MRLAKLLEEKRGVKNLSNLPSICEQEILEWADVYHDGTGKWPGQKSGPIRAFPGLTWAKVNNALIRGSRGLPGGSSLARLLEEKRGARNQATLPPLTEHQILA